MNKEKRNADCKATCAVGPARRRRGALWTALLLLAVLLAGAVAAVAVSAAEDYEVYATDLTPLSASAGDGNNLHYDVGPNGGKLTLRNAGDPRSFDRGIFAHVDSEVVYDAAKYGMKHFSAYIGINDGSQSYKDRASADFEVFADSQSVYKSPILKIDSAMVFVDVDIPAGTERVRLVTTKADNTDYADHSVWADAKFTLDGEKEGVLDRVSLSLPSSILGKGETVKPTLTALAPGGRALDVASLSSISYESSAKGVATVAADGTVTALAPGDATITVTATKGEDTATASAAVHVFDTEAPGTVRLSSPGRNLSILLTLDSGVIRYTVEEDGRTVIEPSPIGMLGTDAPLASGFTYASQTDPTEINETYKNYSGDRANGEDHCNEQSVSFTKGGYTYTVVLRAYDDGFALRSVIESEDETQFVLEDEKTAYTLPAGTSVRAITAPASRLQSSFNYEQPTYSYNAIEAIPTGNVVMFPALIDYGEGMVALLSEAEIYSSSNVMYGSCLMVGEDRALECNPAPIPEGDITVQLPFQTPWRMGVVGDLKTVVESDLVDNLNARPDPDMDLSWIEPGVTAWMWISEGLAGQHSLTTIREYVDLAADMGWKYLILDEGWQPSSNPNPEPFTSEQRYKGTYSWFPQALDYAEKKGVGFIVWVKHSDLDTPAEREVLREWADMGIKGIKADFFDSETQANMADMQEIYRICGEAHLLCNLHGANKPTGERASYPWVIAREAINGEEYGHINSSDTTIWPFTRASIGPADITPTLYPRGDSATTAAQQLAINVVFEDGLPCMASASEEYRASTVTSYFRSLPARWDDLRYIAGTPGTYTVLARRSGSEWWVGGLTSGAQSLTVPLDFLEAGKNYAAILYADGANKNDIVTSISNVTSESSIPLDLPQNGGFVLRILPQEEASAITQILPEREVYTVGVGESARIAAKYLPEDATLSSLTYEVADDSVAEVSPSGIAVGKTPGITTVKIKTYDSSVVRTVELRVSRPVGYVRDESWQTLNGNESYPVKFNASAPNDAVITTLRGDMDKDGTQYPAPQVLVTDAPEGDFTIEVKVSGSLNANFQTVGPVVYGGLQNMVAMTRRSHSYFGGNVFCLQSYFNKAMQEPYVAETNAAAPAYLRLEKTGDVFTGSYSYDGSSWTKIGETITAPTVAGASDLKVGIIACNGNFDSRKEVTASDFKVNGEVKPFMIYNDASDLVQILPENRKVLQGSSADGILPASVSGYLSSGETVSIPVTWDGTVDTSASGERTITGKLGGEYADSGLTPQIKISVVTRDGFDLNGDGKLQIDDATTILTYLATRNEAPLKGDPDLTFDRKVTVKDAARVLLYLGK